MPYPFKLLDVANMGLSPEAAQLYAACFRQGDGHANECGSEIWLDVYLDNAKAQHPFRGKQLSGLFSALKEKGLFRPIDGYAWGEIRVERA